MSLKRALSQMLINAESHPGRPAGVTLEGGLRIELTVRRDKTLLRLLRARVDPSLTEFKTVLAAFPYPVETMSRVEKREAVHYRIATWETPVRLPMDLPEPQPPAVY